MQALLGHVRPATTGSQTERILRALKSGDELTALDALGRFGTLRLAARIAELRERGYAVVTDTREVSGKRIAVYWLPARAEQLSLEVSS